MDGEKNREQLAIQLQRISAKKRRKKELRRNEKKERAERKKGRKMN